MVGEHVVQLAGDPQPLLAGPAPPLLGQRPAVAGRALAPDPDDLGEREHEQRPRQGGRARRPRPAAARVEDGGHAVGEEHAGRDAATRPAGGR